MHNDIQTHTRLLSGKQSQRHGVTETKPQKRRLALSDNPLTHFLHSECASVDLCLSYTTNTTTFYIKLSLVGHGLTDKLYSSEYQQLPKMRKMLLCFRFMDDRMVCASACLKRRCVYTHAQAMQ